MLKLIGAVVLGLVGAAALGGAAKPKRELTFEAQPDAEAAACAEVVKTKPKTYGGSSKPAKWTESQWLGWVAYRMVYPEGPGTPGQGGTPYNLALSRLRACVAAKLGDKGATLKL